MPKIVAHALTGATIMIIGHPRAGVRNWLPLLYGAIFAISADFDIGIDWILNLPDIHRGFTHSLLFAFLVGSAIYFLMPKEQSRVALCFGAAYLSHILLDFLTSTTGGVKLLFPFSNEYYNFGLTSIFELPFGNSLAEITKWFAVETVFFLPVFLFALAVKYKITN
jgi:membrane-bound metal-dependent hydrolase YbcI (DUF457 family)